MFGAILDSDSLGSNFVLLKTTVRSVIHPANSSQSPTNRHLPHMLGTYLLMSPKTRYPNSSKNVMSLTLDLFVTKWKTARRALVMSNLILKKV